MIVMPLDPSTQSQVRPSACRFLAMAAALLLGGTLLRAEPHASVTATCTVRMLPRAAAGYDLSTERDLQGQVEAIEAGVLRLRLKAGWVGVELGPMGQVALPTVGTPVVVVASLQMVDGRQHLVAREVRQDGKRWTLRDDRGVPVSPGSPQL
jgi:hypothetical protein